MNSFYAIFQSLFKHLFQLVFEQELSTKFALENSKKKYEGRGDVFRYAQSDVVLKHSDVLHLWCKVMLSLLFTLPGKTSLRRNLTTE